MNTPFAASLTASLACLALASWGCGAHDGAAPDTDRRDAHGVGPSAEPLAQADALSDDIERPLTELATLVVRNGHDIRFLVNPAAKEITVEESGPVDESAELPLLMREELRDLDALQIYLALTPADRPVPRALYELSAAEDARALAAERSLAELVQPMPAKLIIVHPLVDKDQSSAFMPELCGANGASAFEELCSTGSHPESFCEPGKHVWHGRYSNGKYNKSEGLTVSCEASVRTKHRRKVALTWWEETFHQDADQWWHFTRVENYAPASKYDRYVRMDRYNPVNPSVSQSYIRSWIGFRN